MSDPDAHITMRPPRVEDAATLWELVRRAGALEQNTPYAYLLLCTHFAGTSLVAELDGTVAAFVAAYRPPTHPDTVFVWQIGVDPAARGRRIAANLLHALLETPGCSGIRYLEATVTSSNVASGALFRSVARDLDTACREREHFPASLFPGNGHEAEILFRIGPLSHKDHA